MCQLYSFAQKLIVTSWSMQESSKNVLANFLSQKLALIKHLVVIPMQKYNSITLSMHNMLQLQLPIIITQIVIFLNECCNYNNIFALII